MERSEVIAAAAQRFRAQHLTSQGGFPTALAFVQCVCTACEFQIQPCPRTDVMLDGAHARIQFWSADAPEFGGMIWIAADTWRENPTFAAYAVAHELGHFVLHCGERRAVFRPCDGDAVSEDGDDALLHQRPQSVEEYAPAVRREREANLFAAELLAPRVEVRRLFTRERLGSEAIAARLGITPTLAERRLLAAVLGPSRPADLAGLPDGNAAHISEAPAAALLGTLDTHQRAAATASGPALVVAGPGTGKTATLIGRAAHLLTARGRAPEEVLALTFSNAAAGEMRARLMEVGLPGERMPVMTIHSFATTLLREYASRVPCAPGEAPLRQDFRLLDQADQYLLLEELLPDLPLHYYRALGQPTRYLPDLMTDFSAARDALLTPEAYLALVETMPLAPEAADEDGGDEEDEGNANAKGSASVGSGGRASTRTYTREEVARARERAAAYGVYDRALRARGLVDFGGLIQRAVELLRADPLVLADVRRRYPEVLVDEFQDTNQAAGELILLLAGAGQGLWVVGDANQSIYRWRGASPRNLARLQEQFPDLATYRLLRCYRSVPEIVALASHMAERMYAVGVSSGAISSTTPAPVALRPERASNLPSTPSGTLPPARAVALPTEKAEHAYLVEAIQAARAAGHTYREQALLCSTHKQVREVAAALDAAGVPVAMVGDVFARDEVKDALCLLRLAAGSDGGPLVRVEGLLRMVGVASPPRAALVQVARAFSQRHVALPYALSAPEAVRRTLVPESISLPAGADMAEAGTSGMSLIRPLVRLGQVATGLRYHETVGLPLARALVSPGGYAWRLACHADARSTEAHTSGVPTAGEAQTALAALGALVSLALGFDRRWVNEPDFKSRLSRATRRGTTGFARATPPTAPDALEVPGADVTLDDGEREALLGRSGGRNQSESALAVAAFLHYLGALRAAKASVTVPASEDDTVRVMTLHASKGLEFPVIYLPYLVQGRFPSKKGGRHDASPPGFREADAPGQEEAEQRCLFYVGVTRARDAVVLTRAERYDSKANRKATRSPLLALVDGAPTLATGTTPVTAGDVSAVPSLEEDVPALPKAHLGEGETLPKYTLWELDLYDTCPRKYRYARHYGFYDADEGAVLRFHHFVRRGQRVLREARAEQDEQSGTPAADWDAVAPRVQAAWQEDGPVGHAYEAYYWRHAEAILRQEWDVLASTTPRSTGTMAREVTATLRRCRVEVRADELIEEPDTSPGRRRFTIVRQHTGLPAKTHREDLALALYVLALRQAHPGADVRVVLRYLGNALRSDDPGEQRGEVVDLTDEATRAADKYVKADRKARSTLDKLDEAADGIQAGIFTPHPEEQRCAECAFAYLCPADPAEGEPALIQVRAPARRGTH